MDLIYTDENRNDVGVLKDYSFDLAYGKDENNFELTVNINNNVISKGCFVYIEGTEYGGMVDTIKVNTANKTIKYQGRTFQGILASKIVEPDVGADYYTDNSRTRPMVQNIYQRCSLTRLFNIVEIEGQQVGKIWKFDRYVDAYKGLTDALKTIDYKMILKFERKSIYTYLKPIVTYEDEIISDKLNFVIEKKYNPANHIICLGSGELHDRVVIHLYADADGNISETQTFAGLDEIEMVYDYPNAESTEELIKSGTKKLLENRNNSVAVTIKSGANFDIGDRIVTTEQTTGVSIDTTITKKIVNIKKDTLSINYKVGE